MKREEERRERGWVIGGGGSSGTRYRLILLVNEAEELGPGFFSSSFTAVWIFVLVPYFCVWFVRFQFILLVTKSF